MRFIFTIGSGIVGTVKGGCMKAKKALKKLIKKSHKTPASAAMNQLKALKKAANASSTPNSVRQSSPIKDELKDLAGQVALSAAQELAQPLRPVLSWFNDAGGYVDLTTPANDAVKPNIKQAQIIPTQSRSLVSLPLKSPPCKRCPALTNGVCKCAAKKFKMSA